jgi:hypothetical protein
MNATIVPKGFLSFPERLHWTAQQLVEAVPLRLHEMYAFEAGPGAHVANRATRPPRPCPDFAPCPPLAERFRVR